MTNMQITSAVPTRAAKHPVIRYILKDIFLFLAWYLTTAWATYTIAPLVPGWDECVSQILFRLPFGLICYKFLKRSRPVAEPRRIEKKRFRKFFLFYVLLIQVPIKCTSPVFAASTELMPQTAGAFLVNTFILAPFIEELLFRGVFYNVSRKHLDFWPAAILNGALFAFIHYGKPFTMLCTFLMAVLFCVLYEMTGTIKYGIILHFTFNILTIPMIFLVIIVPPVLWIPFMVASIILHIILIAKKDKLEARLFA